VTGGTFHNSLTKIGDCEAWAEHVGCDGVTGGGVRLEAAVVVKWRMANIGNRISFVIYYV
jgi:hypothetical protein